MNNLFAAVEIDGVLQTTYTQQYQFSTEGSHTVVWVLKDTTQVPADAFLDNSNLVTVYLPTTVTNTNCAFGSCSNLDTDTRTRLLAADSYAFDCGGFE